MGFVKVVKNKAYYKRFQVQFRRRREAKTDYYARKRLIWVNKDKYDAPKYRYVVRFTNRDVICAIVATDLSGDRIVASAYGHDLARYGVKFGFNNFASTYATGLLLARRVNANFGLPYLGLKDAAGKYYNIADEGEDDSGNSIEDRRPFQAVLDVGLHRTTTGSRLFAALKGACDGGINVPHGTRRFPGTPKEKDSETDFEVTRKYIFGGHVADYMRSLEADDSERYNQQFSVAVKNKIVADDIEGLYQSVHDKIRAETTASLKAPARDPKVKGYFGVRTEAKKVAPAGKKDTSGKYFSKTANRVIYPKKKMSVQQRKARILAKLNAVLVVPASAAAAAPAAVEADKKSEESDSGSESDE